jgi:stearoyl-CoA desaturase (delta-9 desaturase)
MILYFFVMHYFLAIFCQTFFLHRYASHRMFHMNLFWERFFHLLTYLSQGASYLNPRGYAMLHRLHHAHSDTAKDPHSPLFYPNAMRMMLGTKTRYENLTQGREIPDSIDADGIPSWPLIDNFGRTRLSSVLWVVFYFCFYLAFVQKPWEWLLLPVQIFLGPIHGAIVNWCGHKYGYRNFDVSDASKNTLALDFVTMGELFQNNHHRFSKSPNFAVKWFEVDPAYQIIKLLARLRVIHL